MTDDRHDAPAAARDERPRPRYGEYAPEGWVNPVAPVESSTESSAPSTAQQGPSPAVRSDAPAAGTWGAPPRPAVNDSTGGRRFDRVATFVLLGIGLYSVVSNVVMASSFSSALLSAMSGAGYSTDAFTSQDALQRVGVIIAVSTVAAFAVTLIWSLRRLAARKVTFWVPLSIGVVMSIVQMVLVLGVLFGDAGFVQSIIESGPSL
ncbi:DUF6264 family protein [Frigoribacterium sp. Leaf172]|uniref:DUF6264 family protein n=1 Tax=Frigoribacterium sp. Leaf172 TaxID=1736285 RepID=UPI0006FB3969|nr:DUF6264 family protein [Frigoribacterium sp. Leaf172]KQR66491.1 hypothetical protein ASF89_05295 [Frigoribacterium sp. Leaf172]